MQQPDMWTIKSLYHDYWRRLNKIDKEYQNSAREVEDYIQYKEDVEYFEKRYIQAMRLVFIKNELSYGGYFAVAEDFIDCAIEGGFNQYDGVGYWVDWDGNEIAPLSFASTATRPENAEFIAWYNN